MQFVYGVARLGSSNTQEVPREGGEAVLVDGDLDVAVVEVVDGEIPVAPIQGDAVGEKLDCLRRARIRRAESRGDVVGARYGGVPWGR